MFHDKNLTIDVNDNKAISQSFQILAAAVPSACYVAANPCHLSTGMADHGKALHGTVDFS
jgi:hypothetical protein